MVKKKRWKKERTEKTNTLERANGWTRVEPASNSSFSKKRKDESVDTQTIASEIDTTSEMGKGHHSDNGKAIRFRFSSRHLLVIGVLALAFTASFLLRVQPADYGYELNEFDPFFNFRATAFLLENGIGEYADWHDTMSWYPQGRDVFATSQVALHVTAASLYQVFGFGSSLYEFTIMFPVVFGSLTAIVIFALVRVIGGTTAGLFSSLFFAVSVPVLTRGMLGWFKSEPLGLFYGLLAVYFLLSGLKSENRKIAIPKLVGAGIILVFGISAWGGIQFFLIPVGVFIIALPFLRKDHEFIVWAVPLFVGSALATSLLFERPGLDFIYGPGGFLLIGPAAYLVALVAIKKISSTQKAAIRNSVGLLAASVIGGIAIISSGVLANVSFRYRNAMNPFLSHDEPLVTSVAEHATPTLSSNLTFMSVLLLFAALGAWLIFRTRLPPQVTPEEKGQETSQRQDTRKSRLEDIAGKLFISGSRFFSSAPAVRARMTNEMAVFALIVGMLGAYAGGTFARLSLFASISVAILASIGLAALTNYVFQTAQNGSDHEKKQGHKDKQSLGKMHFAGNIPRISFVGIITVLLLIPIILPADSNWTTATDIPPTILNGGSNFRMSTQDWPDAMEWIRNNTTEDAVVASWWDYGYWITTLGDRKSLADNATLSTERIKRIAEMFLSAPAEAWKILQELEADYILIYLVGQKLDSSQVQGENVPDLYVLGGGGDESKKQWFIRIAERPEQKYLQGDGTTPTNEFWDSTMLGKMFPFTPVRYVNLNNNQEFMSYRPGTIPIYVKDIKYPETSDDESKNQPLQLVYSSPTFNRDSPGVFSAVLIYKINESYDPSAPKDSKEQEDNTSAKQKEQEKQEENGEKNANVTEAMESIQTNQTAQQEVVTGEVGQQEEVAVVSTNYGDIVIDFHEDLAPNTVKNFKVLAERGFYDGTLFHRIIPGFVIQGGDPNTISGPRDTWGTGDAGYNIKPEFSDLKHEKYVVSMARGQDINSASSQFFIALDRLPALDEKYTIFGKVIQGRDAVDKIASLETNQRDQPTDPAKARVSKISIRQFAKISQ